jgi:hypothetical protein
MISSQIVAHECIAVLKTPNLSRFLQLAKEQDEAWAIRVLDRLGAVLGTRVPEIWSVRLSAQETPAIDAAMAARQDVELGALLRHPADRNLPLPALALGIGRAGSFRALPDAEELLAPGDRLLFVGIPQARRDQAEILRNIKACEYVLTGIDPPVSWLARKLLPGAAASR